MNPLAIVEECEREGIQLFVVDGKTRFRCLRGTLAGALRDRLRENREPIAAIIRAKQVQRLADFDRSITCRMPRHLRHNPRLLRLRDAADAAAQSCDSVALDDTIFAIEQLVDDALDAMADPGPDIWPSTSDRPTGPSARLKPTSPDAPR